jgi:hypothetical protein
VRLERAAELLPKKTGALISTFTEYDHFEQPTDWIVPHEPDLDVRLTGER